MFLPTYNEIPSGWSHDSWRSNTTNVAPPLQDAFSANISGFLRSFGSPASVNIRGDVSSTITIAVGKWLCLGLAMAYDNSKREVFGVSIAGHYKTSAPISPIPFLGSVMADQVAQIPDGFTQNILYRTTFPAQLSNIGGVVSCNFRGHVRGTFTGQRNMLVFGIAVANTHASNALVLDNFQMTVDVTKYNAPDHLLFRPVN